MAAHHHKARGVAIMATCVGMLGVLSSMAVVFPRIDPTYVIAEEAALEGSPFAPTENLALNQPHPLSIAVLPIAAEPDAMVAEPVIQRLARNVINELGGMGMRVADERAAASWRGRDVPHHEQGRALGVRYVLAATVGGNEDDMRVHATLTDCTTKRVLWKGTFWTGLRTGTLEETEIATALRIVLPLDRQGKTPEE